MMLKIDYQDRAWQLDLDEVTLEEGIAIQDYLGVTLGQWYSDLFDIKSMNWLKSAACAHWVMLGQNGEQQPPIGSYRLPVLVFADALLTAIQAVMPEEEEKPPDPTPGRRRPASARSPAPSRTRTPTLRRTSAPASPADG